MKNILTLETIGKYMYIILIYGFSAFDMELAISAKGSTAAKCYDFALAANNNEHFDADTGRL